MKILSMEKSRKTKSNRIIILPNHTALWFNKTLHIMINLELTDNEIYWVTEEPEYKLFDKFKIAFDDALSEYVKKLK